MTFAECIGSVVPYYNLFFVLIALLLFLKLFSIRNKKLFLLPWKMIFAAVIVYIVEGILVVFYYSGITHTPRILNAIFEFAIIVIFIYTLLVQKEYVQNKR